MSRVLDDEVVVSVQDLFLEFADLRALKLGHFSVGLEIKVKVDSFNWQVVPGSNDKAELNPSPPRVTHKI